MMHPFYNPCKPPRLKATSAASSFVAGSASTTTITCKSATAIAVSATFTAALVVLSDFSCFDCRSECCSRAAAVNNFATVKDARFLESTAHETANRVYNNHKDAKL
ncbi:hypothetical protein BWQ96_09767 [Gracilariopsis chorda]|uniref:Uncharacterized protein n=1 Tax=Gracilariopsis chorda TaxID=448386 RepID=A0A2V3IHB7_9FLOR|nr:hypothetical protein BWQ96_09767 [Gracilariopsis chorda]|eukprot:PXF40530.1 hypothetical protein BWQ96_09767 [Gracilariopsis chorda]